MKIYLIFIFECFSGKLNSIDFINFVLINLSNETSSLIIQKVLKFVAIFIENLIEEDRKLYCKIFENFAMDNFSNKNHKISIKYIKFYCLITENYENCEEILTTNNSINFKLKLILLQKIYPLLEKNKQLILKQEFINNINFSNFQIKIIKIVLKLSVNEKKIEEYLEKIINNKFKSLMHKNCLEFVVFHCFSYCKIFANSFIRKIILNDNSEFLIRKYWKTFFLKNLDIDFSNILNNNSKKLLEFNF